MANTKGGARACTSSREHKTGEGAPAQGAVAQTRCGFVALIGAPNVGKSTLVNALFGTKVAIVSHKVQKTRALMRGVAVVDGVQLGIVAAHCVFATVRHHGMVVVAA